MNVKVTVMDQISSVVEARQAGADAISELAIAIAAKKGTTISKPSWDFGDDCAHEYAHRLELFTEEKSVRIYFSDVELTKWESMVRQNRTASKLTSAIDQLTVRLHSPTYAFK